MQEQIAPVLSARSKTAILKHNRVTGDPGRTVLLPAGPGGVHTANVVQEDFFIVPQNANQSGATPFCTLNLNGVGSSTPPADGDEYTISDPYGVLSPGVCELLIVGFAAGKGRNIVAGGSPASSIRLRDAGSAITLVFSGSANAWTAQGGAAGGGGKAPPPPTTYIDPANVSGTASDTNDGLTPGTALRTWKTLVNRAGGLPLQLAHDASVIFMSDQSDQSDPVYEWVVLNGHTWSSSGTLINVASGSTGNTFTAVVALNPATNQAENITDANLPPASWQPFDDFIVEDTTQNPVVRAWISMDHADDGSLPAKTARVSTPMTALQFGTTGTFAATDAYQIKRPTKIFMLGALAQDGSGGTFLLNNHWGSADLFAPTPPGQFDISFGQLGEAVLYMQECRWDGFAAFTGQTTFATPINCDLFGGCSLIFSNCLGGVIKDPTESGVQMQQKALLDAGVLLEGTFAVSRRAGTGARFGLVGVFDPPAGAITLQDGTEGRVNNFFGYGGSVFGRLGGQVAVNASSGARMLYNDTAANAFPIGGNFRLGAGGNERNFDPAQGAGATFSAVIAATIANLDVAVPGGFGGCAVDPRAMAGLLAYNG